MRLVSLLIITFTAAVTLSLPAGAVPERDCRTLNDLWTTRYHPALHPEWPRADFKCPSLDAKLAQAMVDIEAGGFYAYVTARVRGMRKGGLSMSASASNPDGILRLYSNYWYEDRYDSAGTLVHESRHSDASAPKHVDCTRGALIGRKYACDAVFAKDNLSGGAYQVEFAYYLALLRAKPVDALSRDLARTLAKYQLLNRFESIAAADTARYLKVIER